MDIEKLKQQILSLPLVDRQRLISEVGAAQGAAARPRAQDSRRHLLDNKMGQCPHCSHTGYVRFGRDKGSQRYKCKSCKRSFTEYTGTWMAGLHRKDKIDAYLDLMLEEKSLDKIRDALAINKKTAFDWRHKVLSSLSFTDQDDFSGITESDETFFFKSEKGKQVSGRKARKRGGTSKKKGIDRDRVAVIVTQDRKSVLDLTVATIGSIKKSDIEKAIGGHIKPGKAILCSDASVIYRGFALDKKLEHHALKKIINQHIKGGIYHIQHVNSTHNRLKKWMNNVFWGVSTKYLQQYMNWFRVKELIKNNKDQLAAFVLRIVEDIGAYQRYRSLEARYQTLLSTQI
jgi:transposase-like protein